MYESNDNNVDGAAAAETKIREQRVYDAAAKEVNADFVPLATKSYGRLGKYAVRYSRANIKEFAASIKFDGEPITVTLCTSQ